MDQLLSIRAFARVVEAGNFTRAADSLRMPKATLSKLVQTLEAHLGVQLLQRSTRRVAVTAEGISYYEKTARLMRELEEVDASFSSARTRPRGLLRIDLGSSVASRLLVPALPDFMTRYPEIRIDLGVSDREIDLIGDHVDCVIRGGVLADTGLVSRTLTRVAWLTCATPSYIAHFGTPRHPRDLHRDHRIVSYVSARTGRVLPMRFRDKAQAIELDLRHTLGVSESNAHYAAGLAGLGVVQTFSFLAQPAVERGELVSLLARYQPKPYPLHLVYPSNRHVNNRLRVFIDWVAEAFAKVA